MVNWLSQAGTSRCELCHHPFRFEPMYQPNTPQALPTDELLLGVLVRAQTSVLTIARVSLVLIVWLFLLPLGTCWTWYALFIKSLSQFPSLIVGRGISGVITDAFYGCLLSAGIVFVFLGVSSLREYIRHIPDDGGDANIFNDDLDALDDHDAFDAFAHNDLPAPQHAGNAPPIPPNAPLDRRVEPEGRRVGGDGNGHRDGIGPVAVNSTTEANDGSGGGDEVEAAGTAERRERGPDSSHEIGYGLTPQEHAADLAAAQAGGRQRDDSDDGGTGPGLPGAGRGTVRRRPRPGWYPHPAAPPTLLQRADGGLGHTEGEEESAARESDSSGTFEDFYAGEMPTLELSESDDDDLFEEDEEPNGDDNFLLGAGLPENDYGPQPGEEDPGSDVDAVDDEDEYEPLEGEQNDDGGALFGLFELDPDEVPLEEMVGLRGQIRNLFDNAGTVLVSNAIFLVIFTLIPLLVGRLALRVASLHTFPLEMASQYLTAFDAPGNVVPTAVGEASSEAGAGVSNATVLMRNVTVAALAPTRADSAVSDGPVVAYVDNLFVVLLGYGVISLGAFGYVIINSVLRSRYPRLDTPMTRQVFRVLRYLATFVKIVVLIVFEFGIFPLGCGWWLDICTLKLLNSTLESRAAFCREFPWTCTAGHWFLGIFYMVHVSLFVSLLREVLRPELLWFLRNPDDPDFRPFRELVEKPLSRHARRMCLSVCIYAPLILAVVYVPSWLCLTVLPTVFPFNLSDFSNSLLEIPFGNLLVVPLVSLVHHVRPGAVVRRLVKEWIGFTGHALGIAHLILKEDPTEDEWAGAAGNVRGEEDAGSAGDADSVDEDVFANFDAADDVVQANENPAGPLTENLDDFDRSLMFELSEREAVGSGPTVKHVWARGVSMLLLGWSTLILCECVALTVPTVIGRAMLSLVGLSASHDLHALGLGFYVILGSLEVACRIYAFLALIDARTAIALVFPYAMVVGKSLTLVFFWFGVVPLGAGLLVELVVTIPLRVAYNESPYFYLQQDWALGVLLIKVWSRIVLAGGFTARWRDRMERVHEAGFLGAGQNFQRTFQEVVGPVLWAEAVALSVPYVVVHGVLRGIGTDYGTTSFVYRYIYIWCLFVYVLHSTVDKFKGGLYALHDSIRDDKYLVGRRLYNYSRASRASGQT